MKKFIILIIIFVLAIVSEYVYFKEQSQAFIPLTAALYSPEGTTGTLSKEPVNLGISGSAVFEGVYMNTSGHYLIVTSTENIQAVIFKFDEYDTDFNKLQETTVIIDKTQLNPLMYPDKATHLIDFYQVPGTEKNCYLLLTNRIYAVINLDGNTLTLPALPYWIIAGKINGSASYIYNFNTDDGIKTFNDSNSVLKGLVPASASFLSADNHFISLDGGLISSYDSDGSLLWQNKFKNLDNQVQFNKIINTGDGNLLVTGSYHPTTSVTEFELPFKFNKIQNARTGVVLKLDSKTGKVIWEKDISGYNNDNIDLLSATEDPDGHYSIFGYYHIETPTLFFALQLDQNGNMLGDKIFEYPDSIALSASNTAPAYLSPVQMLYKDDTSVYNRDSIQVFGTNMMNGNVSPFMIQYETTGYGQQIHAMNTLTIAFYNGVYIADAAVIGLFVFYILYSFIRKLDPRNKKKKH